MPERLLLKFAVEVQACLLHFQMTQFTQRARKNGQQTLLQQDTLVMQLLEQESNIQGPGKVGQVLSQYGILWLSRNLGSES